MPPRHHLIKWIVVALVVAALVFFLTPRTAAQEISNFATAQEDSSLLIDGNRVRLYGIYVPPTGQTCQTFMRPMPCGTRAQLALNFRIEGHFIHCTPRSLNSDGSLTASCFVEGEDLSEWMLQRGWALALPDAPFAYGAMERIAKARGIGVWGIPVEVPM
jgi:endonuclease YncB( thermonuclease family)